MSRKSYCERAATLALRDPLVSARRDSYGRIGMSWQQRLERDAELRKSVERLRELFATGNQS